MTHVGNFMGNKSVTNGGGAGVGLGVDNLQNQALSIYEFPSTNRLLRKSTD